MGTDLTVHWVLTAACIVIFVACSVTTQCILLRLKRDKTVILQMQNHPHYVTAILGFCLLWQIPSLIDVTPNAGMPCTLYVLLLQIAVTGIASIIVLRTLKFTQRLAQLQCSKNFVYHGAETGTKHQQGDDGSPHIQMDYTRMDFVRSTARVLRGRRVHYISLIFFLLCFLIVFIDPNSRKGLLGDSNFCVARGSSIVVVVWLLFAVPYLVFMHKFPLIDPYRIYFKIKITTAVACFCFVLFFGFSFFLENMIGKTQFALTINKILFVFSMTIWYTESYIPLYLTHRNIAEARKDQFGKQTFLDTITNPKLLERFELHLIEEWSPENLQLYRAVVMFQINSDRAIKCIENILRYVDKAKPKQQSGHLSSSNSKISPSLAYVGSKTNSRGTSRMSSRAKLNLREHLRHSRQFSGENIFTTEDDINVYTRDEAMEKAEHLLFLARLFAYQLYEKYISPWAEAQVNLPSDISGPLHRLFSGEAYEDVRRTMIEDDPMNHRSMPKILDHSPSASLKERKQAHGSTRNPKESIPIPESPPNLNFSPRAADQQVPKKDSKYETPRSSLGQSTLEPVCQAVEQEGYTSAISVGTEGEHIFPSFRPIKRTGKRASIRTLNRQQKRRRKEIEAFCDAVSKASRKIPDTKKLGITIQSPSIYLVGRPAEIIVQIKSLVRVFDPARKQVFQLMDTDSHRRFLLRQKAIAHQ
ncbi:hypothetical protein AAMO2058_001089500 [Amorphochlora amoebiformis]